MVHAHELASFECVLYLSNSWQHFSPHKVWQGLCGINRTLTWWSPYFSYSKVFLCWSVNPITETTIATSNMWVDYEPTSWEMCTCAVPSLCEYWRSQSCTPNGLGQSLVLASRWDGEIRCIRLLACFLTIRIRRRAALEKNGKRQGRRHTSWLQSRRIVIKHCLVPWLTCSAAHGCVHTGIATSTDDCALLPWCSGCHFTRQFLNASAPLQYESTIM